MHNLPNLLWLRAFEASVRTESFTAAAAELGLTQAAISHQVRSLEKTLAVQLFHRRSRHLELTEIGHAYYPSIARALEDIEFSTRGLFGPKVQKTITVSAPTSTTAYCLANRLKQFRADNPDIHIRLLSALWSDVVPDEHVDIDIRLGVNRFEGYHVETLSEETMVPVCAPAIANAIASAEGLADQELIHIHGYQDHWARLFKAQNMTMPDYKAGISVDTTITAVEMVMAGNGVAIIMKRLAVELAATGRLAIPLALENPMGQAHYLLTPAGQQNSSTEVQLFKTWLKAQFKE
jgi:LysR family glycine cleavage system transcriptional activator